MTSHPFPTDGQLRMLALLFYGLNPKPKGLSRVQAAGRASILASLLEHGCAKRVGLGYFLTEHGRRVLEVNARAAQ